MAEFVGVDLHQRYCLIVRMDAQGEVLDRTRVATDATALHAYFDRLEPTAQIVVEATGNWMYLADLLSARPLVLAHPKMTRAIADALAHLLRTNLIPRAYLASPEPREQRELVRYRARLSRDRVRVKTRLRALLAKHGLTVSARDILGRTARRVLASLPLPPAAAAVLAGYLRVADALTAELRESTTRIEAVVAREAQAQLLMSLPGLGAFGALLLSATIGPVTRFPTPKHLVSYLSLAPSVHSSGGHTRYGALTKQGDPDARWMLIEAATHPMRHQPFARLYHRVKARQGTPAARVAVARRLVQLIHCILRERRPFVPEAQWPGCPRGVMVQ